MARILSNICMFFDFFLVVLLCIGLLLFSQVGKPYQRGFFCNDESIQKPYKDSTISTALAAAVGFSLVLVVIVLTEIYSHHQKEENEVSEEPELKFGGLRIPKVIIEIVCVICICLYGAALNQFITDVGKYSLGRLRPHFLDVCKPNWSKFNCTDVRGNYLFITDDVCTVAKGTKKAKESRLSFPSGHSSFSAYIMIFLVLYMEAKLHLPKESRFLKTVIQASFVLLALYTGFSRVSDYKHHWSDVLTGLILGTTVAFVTIFKVLRPRFNRIHHESQRQRINHGETDNVMMNNPKYTEEVP